jgi:hypothetical protein
MNFMENIAIRDPKDEHITNKDDSVTNKDGDNYLEKGEQAVDEMKPDKERVQTTSEIEEQARPVVEGNPKKDSKSRRWVL